MKNIYGAITYTLTFIFVLFIIKEVLTSLFSVHLPEWASNGPMILIDLFIVSLVIQHIYPIDIGDEDRGSKHKFT